MAAADKRVATDTTLQATNTALGGVAQDTTLEATNTAIAGLGGDATLEDIKDAIEALPNATQEAADNANAAATAANTAVENMGGMLAPDYSASATYAVGDYVYYNSHLYRCITAITTAESWTAAHWQQVPLGNDVRDLKSALSNTFDLNITIGRYNASQKRESTTTDAKTCFTSLIPCKTDGITIQYFSGYPYVVHTYDSQLNLTGSDGSWISNDKTVNNKGGYIAIVFSKSPWGDFSQTDVDYLLGRLINTPVWNGDIFNVKKGVDAIGFKPTFTIGNYNNKNKNKKSDNIKRCFSSLIPCVKGNMIVQAVNGYGFLAVYYDSDANYVSADEDWTNYEYKMISNKGGYVAFVFYKKPYQTDFTSDDITYLQDNFLKFPLTFEIGAWNKSQSKIVSNAARCTTNIIPCKEDATIIPYVPGYPFFYWVYDSEFTLTAYEETTATCYSKEIKNKDGYIVVTFAKHTSGDFTSSDVDYLEEHFSIENKQDEMLNEMRHNYTYALAHRFNPINKTGSVGSSNALERCLSSMIYCDRDNLVVPKIDQYRHIIYLFDENKDYIKCYPENEVFISLDSVISNKGGYVSIVWNKPSGSAFTNADVETIKENISNRMYSNSILARNTYNTPILTIFDDDGRDGFIDEADMLEERGASGTFAVITDYTDGTHNSYMTVAQILALRDRGFDAVSHTATHSKDIYGNNYSAGRYCNFSLVEDDDIKDDLKRSRTFLLKYGLNADALAWPWGNYPTGYDEHRNNPDPNDPLVVGADNQRLRYAKIARDVGFKYAVNSTGGSVYGSDFDDMWIPRETLMADNTEYPLSYYTSRLDNVIARGGWMILMTHANDPVYANLEKLTQIVDYALENGVQVLNFKDAYQIKKHSVSLGFGQDPYHHYFVGGDGAVHS